MKKNFSPLDEYMRNADRQFSRFDGFEELGLDGDSGQYLNATGGGGTPQVAKQANPYQVTVTNTTSADGSLILFGAFKYQLVANGGSSANLTVTPQAGVSYNQLITQIAQQPITTQLIRIRSTNTAQVTQVLVITKQDASGELYTNPLYTENYFSAFQQQSGTLDIPYSLVLDGNTWIQTTVLGSITSTTNVTYTFIPSDKINTALSLNGQSALRNYAPSSVPTAMVLAGKANGL